MVILLFAGNTNLPVIKYGGTERVIWWLAKELSALGHTVKLLAGRKSLSAFAGILPYNPRIPIAAQVGGHGADIFHSFGRLNTGEIPLPCLTTIEGNGKPGELFDVNTVFVSQKHARNHNAEHFVYNGMDFDDYGVPQLDNKRKHLLFLAKASVKSKNLAGCIAIARRLNEKLAIVGGYGFSFDRRIRYQGMLGGAAKNRVIQDSKALLFPVIWEEPFGIAMIEALYFGCPVFGTTYGSLPEVVIPEVGFCANSSAELITAMKDMGRFSRARCHEYVRERFSARNMAVEYVRLYERVIAGEKLHPHQPSRVGGLPRRYEFA
jgi:glycosyltransferase involved in cell wall biosynthesis